MSELAEFFHGVAWWSLSATVPLYVLAGFCQAASGRPALGAALLLYAAANVALMYEGGG